MKIVKVKVGDNQEFEIKVKDEYLNIEELEEKNNELVRKLFII